MRLLLCLLSHLAPFVAADAISLMPSMSWDGNDGPWSSFLVNIGTPPQSVVVFPSTSGSSIWAVVPQGCTVDDPTDCSERRGFLFDPADSSSWISKGIYTLNLDTEKDWGYSGNGVYGFDDILFGFDTVDDPPRLNDTMTVGIATKDFMVGTLGLTPNAVSISSFNDPSPSILTKMKEIGYISSLSFGYTAGAYYTPKRTFGSLTLGGYDESRAGQTNLTISRNADLARDLLVGVQAITTDTGYSLLPKPIIALVDSTIAQIYLPLSACLLFESVFGLVWDPTTNLYLINPTQHSDLLAHNVSVSFTIGSTTAGNPVISITFPYAAFDLKADYPLTAAGPSKYFPLRRAANESQYVLGRTFLQQAYLTVDYDRNTFSLSQAQFPDTNVPERLIAIQPPDTNDAKKGVRISKVATVGIVVAIVACTVGSIVTGYLCWRRHRANGTPLLLCKKKTTKKKDLSDKNDTVYHGKPELAAPFEWTPLAQQRSPSMRQHMAISHELRGCGAVTPVEMMGDRRHPVEMANFRFSIGAGADSVWAGFDFNLNGDDHSKSSTGNGKISSGREQKGSAARTKVHQLPA